MNRRHWRLARTSINTTNGKILSTPARARENPATPWRRRSPATVKPASTNTTIRGSTCPRSTTASTGKLNNANNSDSPGHWPRNRRTIWPADTTTSASINKVNTSFETP